MGRLLATAILGLAVIWGNWAAAGPASINRSVPLSVGMGEGEIATAPRGFRAMCATRPQLCARQSAALIYASLDARPALPAAAPMDAAIFAELTDVNAGVNYRVAPATDIEVYGKTDFWTLPGRRGDCEDYAIAKRWELIKRGWPENSLLIAVVRGHSTPYHAVLVARTSAGDYVLDNLRRQVLPWRKAGYDWVIRQSARDTNTWVKIVSARADNITVAETSHIAPAESRESARPDSPWPRTSLSDSIQTR